MVTNLSIDPAPSSGCFAVSCMASAPSFPHTLGQYRNFKAGTVLSDFETGSGIKQSAFDLLFIFPTVEIACPEKQGQYSSTLKILFVRISHGEGKKLEATPKLPDSYG